MKKLLESNQCLVDDKDILSNSKQELNKQLLYIVNTSNITKDILNNKLVQYQNELDNIKSINDNLINDQNIKEEVIKSLSSSNQRLNDNVILNQAEIKELK